MAVTSLTKLNTYPNTYPCGAAVRGRWFRPVSRQANVRFCQVVASRAYCGKNGYVAASQRLPQRGKPAIGKGTHVAQRGQRYQRGLQARAGSAAVELGEFGGAHGATLGG